MHGTSKSKGDSDALQHLLLIVGRRPLDINIETVNTCPMRCTFCPNHKHSKKKEVMEEALFRKICREYELLGGGAIGICSMQSDIFSDPLLLRRIAVLREYRSLRPYSTTNLVGAASMSDQELHSFLNTFKYIEISIGGLTKKEYQTLYGVDAFDIVKGQLKRVTQLVKKEGIAVDIQLSFRTNRINLMRAYKYFNNLVLAPLGRGHKLYNTRNKFFSWGGLVTERDLPKGAKLSRVDNSREDSDCVIPWSTLGVNVDGTVTGCGCIDWQGRHLIGDLKSQTMTEVWNGIRADDFRNSFSRGRVPPICLDCSNYLSRDSAFSRPALSSYKVSDGLHFKL